MISGIRERLIERKHKLERELSEIYRSEEEFQKDYAEAERQLKVSSIIRKVTRKLVPVSITAMGVGAGFTTNIDVQLGFAITGISTFMLIVKLGILKMCKDYASDASETLAMKDVQKARQIRLEREINDLAIQIRR